MTSRSVFKFSVQGGTLAVRGVLAELLSALEQLNLNIDEAGAVEIVMAETLNNIVKHAYKSAGQHGQIDIRCEHKQDGLHFRTTDFGRSMPNGRLPDSKPAALDGDPSDLPEGGFGWSMIKSLATDIRYRRIDHKNQLDIRLAVAVRGPE